MEALRGGSSAGGGRKGEARRASPAGMRLPPGEKRTRGKRNLRGRWRERERERERGLRLPRMKKGQREAGPAGRERGCGSPPGAVSGTRGRARCIRGAGGAEHRAGVAPSFPSSLLCHRLLRVRSSRPLTPDPGCIQSNPSYYLFEAAGFSILFFSFCLSFFFFFLQSFCLASVKRIRGWGYVLLCLLNYGCKFYLLSLSPAWMYYFDRARGY